MASQNINKLGEAKIGETVHVPVPDVEMNPTALSHILALMIDVNKNNMTYKLACKYGILKGNY
jgi:hypothetical protein